MAGYIGSGASVVSSGTERKKVFDITTNTTSLTGLNYTVGKVHVFHNGVRLVDGTDYTATNSTSITLTVAAVSGDQVVVVSYASFQVADLPSTSTFLPVAVTGTTPSLDVGTYNFFDQGALTANTTVSFASVPTEANWRYSYDNAIVTGDEWDVSTAVHDKTKTADFFTLGSGDAAVLGQLSGIFFKSDGLKLYVADPTSDDIFEYNLSTAWDTSTLTYVQALDISAKETSITGLFFKSDGTKLYIVGTVSDSVHEYDLSTAWDISTSVFLQTFSISAQENVAYALFFKPDGTKMYIVGTQGDDVNEYDLSTAWDISTSVYLQNFSVFGESLSANALFFKPDGTEMYLTDASTELVLQYTLSTAWDISTASYTTGLSVFDFISVGRGIFFKPDGSRLFASNLGSAKLHTFNLGTLATVTLPAAVQNSPTGIPLDGERTTLEFFTMDGGTTVKLIGEEIV
jgi:sugar lactone lactonase YvrE